MAQSIIELTTLTPSPNNYILYHHHINDIDYFSLKNKSNTHTHFVFKKLSQISINNTVFNTALELINAFNQNFNSDTNSIINSEYNSLFTYTSGPQTITVPNSLKVTCTTLNEGRILKKDIDWARISETTIAIIYNLEENDQIYITGLI